MILCCYVAYLLHLPPRLLFSQTFNPIRVLVNGRMILGSTCLLAMMFPARPSPLLAPSLNQFALGSGYGRRLPAPTPVPLPNPPSPFWAERTDFSRWRFVVFHVSHPPV